MEVNDQGILQGFTFWKMGCNWGTGAPSFYEVVRSHQIVICHQVSGTFQVGDLILIADGHTILALAQVEGKPIPILEDVSLVEELEQYNVGEFEQIYYYPAHWIELSEEDRFLYELQQGIIRVRNNEIKRKASERWLQQSHATFGDKRIMRLTWNTNNWEYPSGHKWSPANQNNNSKAFENKFGYGGEEWLFDERFRINGYQYGYIRGVENLPSETDWVAQITLYTIRFDKQRCLVGTLYNVEMIRGFEEEEQNANTLIEEHYEEMLLELKTANADHTHFVRNPLLFNVKFKWEDADLLNHPMPVDYLVGARFNRFQAYHLSSELFQKVHKETERRSKFNFQPGKASHTTEHTRSTSSSKKKVRRRHGEITDAIYDYLIAKNIKPDDISVDFYRTTK